MIAASTLYHGRETGIRLALVEERAGKCALKLEVSDRQWLVVQEVVDLLALLIRVAREPRKGAAGLRHQEPVRSTDPLQLELLPEVLYSRRSA